MPILLAAADQISDAREHLAEAVYYAGQVGASPHTAVREIDAALRMLYAARQQLVDESARSEQAMLAQYAAYDTYRSNILATIPVGDHQTGMCVIAGCNDHLPSKS